MTIIIYNNIINFCNIILMVKYNPLNFTKSSTFIFDLREKKYKSLISEIKDLNSLKPTINEINFFKNYIESIKNNIMSEIDLDSYEISEEYKKGLLQFIPGIQSKNRELKAIEEIIINYKNREKLNLKIIKRKFNKVSNKKISKTSIYYLIKNKLGYKYLKTSPKTKKIENHSSILRTFIFIKSFISCINKGLIPIFIDESNFQTKNNKLYVWRKRDESPLFNVGNPERRNLILAVSSEEKIYYEINKGTNTNDSFLKFFEILLKKIPKEKKENYFFVFDNCSIHLTKTLLNYYEKNKLKVITIVPFYSQLNSIELNFRYIKHKIYRKIYKNINKMESDIKQIIDDEEFARVNKKLYLETLNFYLKCINKYIMNDLNND